MKIKCVDCGRTYKTTQEITQAGGKVQSLGLALVGVCACGCDLGNVCRLWEKVKNAKDKR